PRALRRVEVEPPPLDHRLAPVERLVDVGERVRLVHPRLLRAVRVRPERRQPRNERGRHDRSGRGERPIRAPRRAKRHHAGERDRLRRDRHDDEVVRVTAGGVRRDPHGPPRGARTSAGRERVDDRHERDERDRHADERQRVVPRLLRDRHHQRRHGAERRGDRRAGRRHDGTREREDGQHRQHAERGRGHARRPREARRRGTRRRQPAPQQQVEQRWMRVLHDRVLEQPHDAGVRRARVVREQRGNRRQRRLTADRHVRRRAAERDAHRHRFVEPDRPQAEIAEAQRRRDREDDGECQEGARARGHLSDYRRCGNISRVSTADSGRWWRWTAALAAALLLSRTWTLAHRAIDLDEFEHAHAAWATSHGAIPYVDFFEHHPPALYLVSSPIFARFPVATDPDAAMHALFAARAAMWILTLAAALVVYRLASAWTDAAGGIAAVLLLATASRYLDSMLEFRPDVPAMLALLAAAGALTAAARASGRRTTAWCAAAGLAFGIALLFTQKVIFA